MTRRPRLGRARAGDPAGAGGALAHNAPMSRTGPTRRARAAWALALLGAGGLAAGCGDAVPGAATAGRAAARTNPAVGTTAATALPPHTPGTSSDPARRAKPTGARKAVSRHGHRIPPAHPVPAAFRPAAGAPSDAEVARELAQLGTIQREERERALSAAAANLAGLLPWTDEPKSGVQVSVASVFRDYGLGLACGGLLGRFQLGVAHKTAPCGTLITFTYAGRSLTVPVIDRGPFIAGREWDLTGATADALGFPGLGQIAWALAR